MQNALEDRGVTVFVDEEDLWAGGSNVPHMQAACCGATVVVFVMTQDFLMREWCMRELQWALQQRQRSGSRMLPELLPVFLPCGLVAEDRFDVDDLFGDSSMAMLKLSTPDDASEDVFKE